MSFEFPHSGKQREELVRILEECTLLSVSCLFSLFLLSIIISIMRQTKEGREGARPQFKKKREELDRVFIEIA